MTIADRFTHEEERSLAEALHAGGELLCSRCEVVFDERPVPPRQDVSYVRDRVWLVCPSCHRTVVLDRRDPG